MTVSAIPASIAVGHRAGTASYRRLILAVMAGGFANFSLLYFVQPLLPLLATQYQVTPAESAHVLSITTLTIIAGLLMAGPLSDRFGRVPIMRWSLVGSGLLGIASAFAPSWGVLLLLRGLLGITSAWLPAAALAYLREEVQPGSHSRANAAYIAGTALGGAAGRLLPGPIAALGGWPLAAATMGILTLVSGAALWLMLPPSQGFSPRRVAVREMLLGTIAAPRDPVIGWLSVAGFAAMGTFVAVYNAMAFRLQAPPFLLGHAASLVYLAYLFGIAAPLLLRRFSDRIGRGCATIAAAVMLMLAVVIASITTLTGVVIGLGLITFAFLGVHSLLSGWVVDRAARRGLGTAQASSAYLLAYYLGSTTLGALATWLWQTNGWSAVEALGVAAAGLAIIAAAVANRVDLNPRVSAKGNPTHL
ncbi:MAG TPA: MFS transporter [Propionicimonas sp.]|nr:MFS transporter [Propionicimonas sp.]